MVKTYISLESIDGDSLTCLHPSSELEISKLRPPGWETVTSANCKMFVRTPSRKFWLWFQLTALTVLHIIQTQFLYSCLSCSYSFWFLWLLFSVCLQSTSLTLTSSPLIFFSFLYAQKVSCAGSVSCHSFYAYHDISFKFNKLLENNKKKS